MDEGFFCKKRREMYCLSCERGERSDMDYGSSYRPYCSTSKEPEEHYRVIILYEGEPNA